jgi:spore maturation protein CgeB
VSGSALDIVIFGLSITSSWGNGHATTYRALVRALAARGHRVLFLERDVPWYAENRDLPPQAGAALYAELEELDRFRSRVAEADLVIVGSFVPDGRAVARWVLAHARGLTAFYDIDTPATLAAVTRDRCPYLDRSLIPLFDLYLSFTGGPTLTRLERELGARCARPLYCSFDPLLHHPEPVEPRWDLGYLGTYSADRQPALERLLLEPARQMPDRCFVVAGALYPNGVAWPAGVDRTTHVSPAEHRAFYCGQRFTLNLTRADMVTAGHSPSVRLFEAAACGTPVISDWWPGLEALFVPGREVLVARGTADVLRALDGVPAADARQMGERARRRVLAQHTAEHRAAELEAHLAALRPARAVQYA